MIAVYRIVALRGGYEAKLACDWLTLAAQGHSRDEALSGAVVSLLRDLAERIEAEEIAVDDVLPLRLEEAP